MEIHKCNLFRFFFKDSFQFFDFLISDIALLSTVDTLVIICILFNCIDQGWPTQIGLWAAFGKIYKNIDFLGQIFTKFVEKHSKYRKITEFQIKIGPQKSHSGPRVGHPWYKCCFCKKNHIMVKIVELKILLSNREIVKTKIKIVNYFLVCIIF